MIDCAPVWASGALAQVQWIEGRPLAWRVRLDDEQTQRDAGRAVLSAREVAAFAHMGDAPWRITRRLLAKALIAHVARCHPDHVLIERDAFGALGVVAPAGWHLSLAGQPPHALIGLDHAPIGVDIEPETAAPPPDDAFSADELAALDKLWPGNADRARLIGWVAKEAHAKASARARQLGPRDIELGTHVGVLVAQSCAMTTHVYVSIDSGTIAAVAI
ncbi:4'-phosphopantetheinyl transferase superfamily protein [Novosphingobium sp.]|uniref:4'-phosphopantetheinyl transferase family protein n=1 Tax=Novosphingobium sp. TaxID=1874826 RepID=UPI0025FA0BCB|nr:4'-phosphopantetheinyl transferase superfamily protein [Novosphingobium sp.]